MENTETEFVVVDTVSMFRMRYVIEVPKGKSEYALDTVVCEEAVEFSQEHIGENIVSYRTIEKDKIIELCDKDNHFCAGWSDEQKFNVYVTTLEKQDSKNESSD
jgi:hypothetical protein